MFWGFQISSLPEYVNIDRKLTITMATLDVTSVADNSIENFQLYLETNNQKILFASLSVALPHAVVSIIIDGPFSFCMSGSSIVHLCGWIEEEQKPVAPLSLVESKTVTKDVRAMHVRLNSSFDSASSSSGGSLSTGSEDSASTSEDGTDKVMVCLNDSYELAANTKKRRRVPKADVYKKAKKVQKPAKKKSKAKKLKKLKK